MGEQEQLLFGKIAVHNKIISQEELNECVAAWRASSGDDELGQVILDRGVISEKQYQVIDKALVKHLEKKKKKAPPKTGMVASPSEEPAARTPKPKKKKKADVSATIVEGDLIPAPSAGNSPGDQLRAMLSAAREMGGSDLHVSPGAPPFVRYHGNIVFFDVAPWGADVTKKEILALFPEDNQKQILETWDLDTAIEFPGLGRYRANVLKQRRGLGAVFRIINEIVPTLEGLGLPDVLKRFTTYHQGIVLVTGASGSGKSSTLAALTELINQNRKENIITLEDPIEFIFQPKKCNIIQRQVEKHTESWAVALKAALREDPDVIMVGEMRDLDTISLAVTAAETGHLVLATLHTTNVTRTIDRVLDVFPPKEQAQIRAMVSESLKGVISQQLVPTIDGKGLIPAVEILVSTPAVGNLIRERRTFQLFSILQTGKKLGMKLMDDSLMELVVAGKISREEARRRAQNPKRFDEL